MGNPLTGREAPYSLEGSAHKTRFPSLLTTKKIHLAYLVTADLDAINLLCLFTFLAYAYN